MKILSIILSLFFSFTAHAANPIKIGDIMPYTLVPNASTSYKNGYLLGVEQINKAGGVCLEKEDCRPLEVLFREGFGKPGKSLRVAQELVEKDNVTLLTGTLFDHVALAVNSFSKRHKILLFRPYGTSEKFVYEDGHRYSFLMGTNTLIYMAMLVEEAAKRPAKNWAILAPNYEYGHSAARAFKKQLQEKRPDVQFVYEHFSPTLKLNAGSVVQAMEKQKPDAVFTALFGSDIAKFIRESRKREFLKERAVVSVVTGLPEEIELLGAQAPVGWISLGYPYHQITDPAHKDFIDTYQNTYQKGPTEGSLQGYLAPFVLKAVFEKAGALDTEKLVKAFEGLKVETVLGPIVFRALDHQSNIGKFIGRTGFHEGHPTLVDWVFKQGDDYMPPEDYIKTVRP